MIGMLFTVILEVIAPFIFVITLATARLAENRGTNVVTKFVRTTVSNLSYKLVVTGSTLCTVMFFLVSVLFRVNKLFCIPCLLTTVAALVLMSRNNKHVERVKSTRAVTKGTLETVGDTGEVIGTAIGTATGKPLAGAVIGDQIGEIADQAADNMEDVDSQISLQTKEKFYKACSRAGIPTEDREFCDVVQDVLTYAPRAMTEVLPADMSDSEKAITVLCGAKELEYKGCDSSEKDL